MIDALVLLFATYLLTWPAFIALLILGIFFEHTSSRKMAVFVGIVTMLVSFFFFEVAFSELLIWAAVYTGIGVAWSFWRYRRYVEERAQYIRELKSVSQDTKASMAVALAPGKNLDSITAWIIIWPFSLVENVLGDVINSIQRLVTGVFKGVYHKIYNSLVGDLIDPVKKD